MTGWYLWRWGLFRKLYLHKDGGGKWTPKFDDAYYFNDKQTAEMAAGLVWENCRVGRVVGFFTLGGGQ